MLNAVSATGAILRRPIVVAFYDTDTDTDGIRRKHSRLKPPGPHVGIGNRDYLNILFIKIYSRTLKNAYHLPFSR